MANFRVDMPVHAAYAQYQVTFTPRACVWPWCLWSCYADS